MIFKITKEFLKSKWFVLGEDNKLRLLTDVYTAEADGSIPIEYTSPMIFLSILARPANNLLFRIRRLTGTRGLESQQTLELDGFIAYAETNGWDTTYVHTIKPSCEKPIEVEPAAAIIVKFSKPIEMPAVIEKPTSDVRRRTSSALIRSLMASKKSSALVKSCRR